MPNENAPFREPSLAEIETEAELRRVFSGFKLTTEQARDRVCDSMGWVSYAHCVRCKEKRDVR